MFNTPAAPDRGGADQGPVDVLVFAPYPHGTAPGQRFRFEQWADRLRTAGIRLHEASFLRPELMSSLHRPGNTGAKAAAVARGMFERLHDLLRAHRFDVALVFREATPIGYPWVERALAATGVPYIFDFDDAIYLSNASEANRGLARLKFAGKASIVARHASLVVAGNEFLAAWAAAHSSNVEVIPTTIDLDKYVPPTRRPGRRICVGWSGSVTTVQYLNALAPLLAELQAQYDIGVRVIGDEAYEIPGVQVDSLPWRASSEIEDLAEIDIGLMPLPDDEWARGKCGLKALQYMALGIPTVMSPVGVNREIAADGAAVLASSVEEWRRALTDLITDSAKRASLGGQGRSRVEARYSADMVAPRWANAFRRVACQRK